MKMLKYILSTALICCSVIGTLQAQTADTLELEVTGIILSKSGKTVKMNAVSDTLLPALKVKGELSKYFERELFGGIVTGWMSIGTMEVTAVSGKTISFLLVEELSVVYENGVKKDHFKPGQKVKFVWKHIP